MIIKSHDFIPLKTAQTSNFFLIKTQKCRLKLIRKKGKKLSNNKPKLSSLVTIGLVSKFSSGLVLKTFLGFLKRQSPKLAYPRCGKYSEK
jgi:hypothetical protein